MNLANLEVWVSVGFMINYGNIVQEIILEKIGGADRAVFNEKCLKKTSIYPTTMKIKFVKYENFIYGFVFVYRRSIMLSMPNSSE